MAAKLTKKKPAPKKKAPKTETKRSHHKKPTAPAAAVVVADKVVPAVNEKEVAAAQKQNERIKALATHIGRKWSDLGLELRDFKENHRWAALGYKSLNAWITDVSDELGFKRSTFYDVATIAQKLQELPAADVREMPRENAKDLARLPESKRKALVEDAKSTSNREFRKKVNAQLEGAAREKNIVVSFSVPESQADQLEEALSAAGWCGETPIRAEQLEFICVEFLGAQCDHPDALHGESNQTAYRRLHPVAEKAEAATA